jgi:adenine-specific DNA-methyltransferase
MIFLYTKGNEYTWNEVFLPLPTSTVENWYRNVEPETGRRYNKADITGPGGPIKGNPVYEWKGITKAWRFSLESMKDLESQGKIVYSESGMPYLKRYLDESKGVSLQDWWDDISMIRGIQRRGDSHYPTEKPEKLIERILAISTVSGDLVLDCFAGSGTTAAVAQKLGRRWIIADINKGAIQTASKRLQHIVNDQIAAEKKGQVQPSLLAAEVQAVLKPAQLAFSIYRINDYDLQIQHNEMLNLAIEHVGIERLKGDSFFEGTLGKRLVHSGINILDVMHSMPYLGKST